MLRCKSEKQGESNKSPFIEYRSSSHHNSCASRACQYQNLRSATRCRVGVSELVVPCKSNTRLYLVIKEKAKRYAQRSESRSVSRTPRNEKGSFGYDSKKGVYSLTGSSQSGK
ncbi:hypothetical protein AMTR_s00007p00240350 [Amborella trichopoda]|uniref:Uncharacterized protein n=1 Tax=Amborella trichopoda TaxID=13333 RepID=W1PCT2_AMBTC|nr:hypothetical protein AMTR_s00007p00240350 [Amborella trichopoda]